MTSTTLGHKNCLDKWGAVQIPSPSLVTVLSEWISLIWGVFFSGSDITSAIKSLNVFVPMSIAARGLFFMMRDYN